MNLIVEDGEMKTVTLPTEWIRFLMRLRAMKKGHRYQIVLDIDARLGPSWTVMELGKIERGLRVGATNGNGLD